MSEIAVPGVGFLTTDTEPDEFHRERLIGVGFGHAGVYRDGVCVVNCDDLEADDVSGADAEAMAMKDPNHVWEIKIQAPLSGAIWRREGTDIGRWLQVENLGGFA